MSGVPGNIVTREFLVRGGNTVSLRVKEWLSGRVYIVCEDGPEMITRSRSDRKDGPDAITGKKPDFIPRGAILVSNRKLGRGGKVLFMSYDKGLYEALRGQAKHVGDGYDKEWANIKVSRGSLALALQLSWCIRKGASEVEIQRYLDAVESARVSARLPTAKDQGKMEADQLVEGAHRITDVRKRMNMPSRGMKVWAADARLCGRVSAGRDIRSHLDPRIWSLVALSDALWELKHQADRDIDQALTWWYPGKKLTREVARRKADCLERVARDLRAVSVAPFGRRGFPRTAVDLVEAATLLRTERFREARIPLERAQKSMLMTARRRALEEVLTVVARVRSGHLEIVGADQVGLSREIANTEFMFFADGAPIDSTFVNPVCEVSVHPPLRRAYDISRETPLRAQALYKNLVEACDPL